MSYLYKCRLSNFYSEMPREALYTIIIIKTYQSMGVVKTQTNTSKIKFLNPFKNIFLFL